MTAHRPAQIARYVAIVAASAASLSLTIVAGAYIGNQMADTHRPGGQLAAPGGADHPEVTDPAAPWPTETRLTSGNQVLPRVFGNPPADAIETTPKSATAHSDSAHPWLDGSVHVGTAYLGAQLVPQPADRLTLTVDTNAVTVLSGFLLSEPIRQQLGVSAAPSGNTQVRTEIDTQRGTVTLLLSDPALGEHSARLDRYPAPGNPTGPPSTPPDSTAHDGLPSTTAPPNASSARSAHLPTGAEDTVAL